MRRFLSLWNLLGGALFLLGLWAYLATASPRGAKALPLPAGEEEQAQTLVLNLERPSPQGFLGEKLNLELKPGEDPYARALKAWAEALKAPSPLGLFRYGKVFVVDLPQGFAQGLDAEGEALRVYSLAYTLLRTFPEAEAVRFLVEGAPSPGLAHLDLSEPIRLP